MRGGVHVSAIIAVRQNRLFNFKLGVCVVFPPPIFRLLYATHLSVNTNMCFRGKLYISILDTAWFSDTHNTTDFSGRLYVFKSNNKYNIFPI